MASSFPTSLDSLANPAASDDEAAVPHHTQHANANDCVENIEAKVGIDGSAVATSLDYLMKNTTSGHFHDGATSRKTRQDKATTKGDLCLFDGTNYVRVGVGTDGTVLAADSAQTSGVSWSGTSAGAPATATYVTTAAEAGLSAEAVLGSAVIMEGTAGARPAAGTAGRLYHETDTNQTKRDNGSSWILLTDGHAQSHSDADHTAGFGTPVAIGAVNNAGVLTTHARSDHVHSGGGGGTGSPFLRTGAIAETFSRLGNCANQNPLTSGTVTAVGISLDAGTVVTNITFMSGTTGAGTPTHWWFGIEDSTRVIRAISTDQTTTAWAASTEKTLAMGTPYTIPADGIYYLFIMVTATTVPTLQASNTSAAVGILTPVATGNQDTGKTTAPAVSSTLIAFTSNAFVPWGWIS